MSASSAPWCADCDPYPPSAILHATGTIERWSLLFERLFFFIPFLFNRSPRVEEFCYALFLRMLIALRLVRAGLVTDRCPFILSRTQVFARAARERGLSLHNITIGKRHTDIFFLTVRGKKIFFDGLPLPIPSRPPPFDYSDKFRLKRFLAAHRFPHAPGNVFRSAKKACAYAETLGFPLVVKPCRGSLSKHTTAHIPSLPALARAIESVQKVTREFIVERHYDGNIYRATIVGGRMVACCLREPPNVIGDGARTIHELVTEKNSDPRRGQAHEKHYTLHRIATTPATTELLAAQGLTLESVPPTGKRIYLHHKVVLACGADIHDVTNSVHPENKKLFEDIARLCEAPLLGIDFIAQDIAAPHHAQRCAIIETNSLPYIDMHHEPSTGTPRDIAGALLNLVLLCYNNNCNP